MISKIQKTLLNIKKNIPMGGLWAFSVHDILFRAEETGGLSIGTSLPGDPFYVQEKGLFI